MLVVAFMSDLVSRLCDSGRGRCRLLPGAESHHRCVERGKLLVNLLSQYVAESAIVGRA